MVINLKANETLRYMTGARVAHVTYKLDGAQVSVCGLTTDVWLGTADAREFEKAQSLPLCGGCKARRG